MTGEEGLDLERLAAIPDPLDARPRSAPPPAPPPTPALAGPTRSELRKRRLAAVVLGIVWLVAIQLLIGIRHDVPPVIMALHVGVPALLGGVALWLSLDPGKIGLGPSIKVVGVFAAVAPLVFAVAALSAPCFESGVVLAAGIFLCGDFIMAAALVPLLALVWAQRRSDAVGAGVRSGLVGVAVGFTAAGLQALHCDHSDGIHVLVGHLWPVLVMGLVGWRLLRRPM